jgi:plastocyanin
LDAARRITQNAPMPRTDHRSRRLAPVLAALFLAALLAACGDDGGDAGDGGGGGAGDEVVIADFAFTIPSGLSAGATLTVRNDDSTTHTFTADGGEFDTGNVGGSESAEIELPDAPGDYGVHCEIHRSMSGTVTVG